MKWLLDTNAVIHAIRGRPPAVRTRLQELSPEDVYVSAVTIAELWYGIGKSDKPARTKAVFEAFLEPYEVLPFDRRAAQRHGTLRHALRHHPIGERDLFIAAIAIEYELCVVTKNTREFERIAGLAIEDWTALS